MTSNAHLAQLPVTIMAASPMINQGCRGVDAGADRGAVIRR